MASSLWTVQRRRCVEKFVRNAATLLRLEDWDIRLDFDQDAGDDAIATCTHLPHQKRAVIRFNALLFLAETAADQRQCLVHELLHCHLFDLSDTAVDVASRVEGGKPARKLARTVVLDRVEWATDALADAFVSLVADLPVPASVSPLRAVEEAAAAARRRR